MELNITKETPKKLILSAEYYVNITGKQGVRPHNQITVH